MISSGGNSIKALTPGSSKFWCAFCAIAIHSTSEREASSATFAAERTKGKGGREDASVLDGGVEEEEEEDCLAALACFLFWELDTTGVYPSVSIDVVSPEMRSEIGESLSAVIG